MRLLLAASLGLFLAASTARAEIIQMPVPSRTLPAGVELAASDFLLKEFSVTEIAKSSYAISVDQFTKMEPLRPLLAGKPVALASLRRAVAIRKGEQVTAIYKNAGLTIQNKLVALHDGGLGDVIEARNPSTGLIVHATVAAGGVLEVSGQ